MLILYKNKKYSWYLFIGYLVIEKVLKALYAKQNIENPHCVKTHNLLLLAKKCNIELDEGKMENFNCLIDLILVVDTMIIKKHLKTSVHKNIQKNK